jgi:parallel beta-helix repeat protein
LSGTPFCKLEDGFAAAPYDGTVTTILVAPGSANPPGEAVYTGGNDHFLSWGARKIHLINSGGPDAHSHADGSSRTKINANPSANGSGVDVSNSPVSVRGNVIADNTGVGIKVNGNPSTGSTIIEDNLITENAGGVWLSGSSATVRDNQIVDNETTSFTIGGGITVSGSASGAPPTTPRIEGNLIEANSAPQGGGMYITDHVDAIIVDCAVVGNTATSTKGGGVRTFNVKGNVSVVNCDFRGNRATTFGGGAFWEGILFFGQTASAGECDADPALGVYLQNVNITCNEAVQGGGMFFAAEVEADVVNVTVSNNSAYPSEFDSDWGGGIAINGNCTRIVNSILWDNTTETSGRGPNAAALDDSTLNISYSILGNGCDVVGIRNGALNCEEETNIIDADPEFEWPDGPDFIACNGDEDYHIVRPSPAIDVGSNPLVRDDFADLDGDASTCEKTPEDFDGLPRFVDDPFTDDDGVALSADGCNAGGIAEIVDLGAYEFQAGVTWPPPPGVDPNKLGKNRYISVIPAVLAEDPEDEPLQALRVGMLALHHPTAPPAIPEGTPDFGLFELANCEENEEEHRGCVRYVDVVPGSLSRCCNPNSNPTACFPSVACTTDQDCFGLGLNTRCYKHLCPSSAAFATFFKCAKLSCNPVFQKWGTLADGLPLHITAPEIVPSSFYEVQTELESGAKSDVVRYQTARWGDINSDTVPNAIDIAEVVDAVKDVVGAFIKPQCQLRETQPNPLGLVNGQDIARVVDGASKAKAYPFAGPVACPE